MLHGAKALATLCVMSNRSASRVRLPSVVLVSGEPGSGKTTLGGELARSLRLPFLARDDVRGGLFFTAGAWSEHPGSVPSAVDAVGTFLRLVESMAGLGVSCVAEHVVRRDRPRDLERITTAANCVVVQTWCEDAPTRLARRTREDRLLRRKQVLATLGYQSIDEHMANVERRMAKIAREMRTDFDLPLLRVNTDRGYAPGLDEIVAFVAESTAVTAR